MNVIINKAFSIFLILLCLSFAHISNAAAEGETKSSTVELDTTAKVICNIIGYVWGIGGPLMTVVIIGAAMLAIFGRMPWPALFALGVFCAVFFGAGVIVSKVMVGIGGANADFITSCGK